MILIADSGSTKTDWVLIDGKDKILTFKTIGLNPVFVNSDNVIQELTKTKITKYAEFIHKIYFYGAGCSSDNRKKIISYPLKKLFANATIIVESDLLGAAISQFGKEDGIIGILGTGSNTGVYKNGKIVKNISSLGYILGDEGSGAAIGKAFIKLLLDNELPENIETKFYNTFNLDLSKIINRIYKEPFPNKFLASFMPFINNNKNNETIKNMLYNSFENFFDKTILKYENYQEKDLRLIGSISFYFSDIIKEICYSKDVKLTSLTKSPLKGLILNYTN